jgi:hypothetical protein
MPYGLIEFAVKDPNGYLLSFGQLAVGSGTSRHHGVGAQSKLLGEQQTSSHRADLSIVTHCGPRAGSSSWSDE